MAKIKIIQWTYQPNADGTCPLRLRIYKGGRRKLINTGYSVTVDQWDEKAESVLPSYSNYKWLNNFLLKMKSDAMSEGMQAETKDYQATTEQIVKRIKGKSSDYFEFSNRYLQTFNNPDQIGTYSGHIAALNTLKEYIGREKLSFNEINVTFIREYATYRKGKGKKPNTINKDLSRIKALYNAAVQEEQAEDSRNPFNIVKLTTVKTKREKLTIDELKSLINSNPKVWSGMWHAKQVFLLQFHIRGVRVSDILTMAEKHVVGGRYSKLTQKSDDDIGVKLNKEVIQILDTYRKEKAKRKIISPYLLPLVKVGTQTLYRRIGNATAYLNNELRDLMNLCGIKKHISTHAARRTYAQIAKHRIKDIHTLKELFGHSSIAVTQNYLADLDSVEMDEANAIVTTI